MPINNFERFVTPSLIREVFQDSIIGEGNKGWCILLSGNIVTINGKMFFNSKPQAVKAFYNSFHWKAGSAMYRVIHPNSEVWNWWSDPNRTACWKTFKKVLERDYGLKIVRV